MNRADELKLVRNALIEAIKNGRSEPISIDYKLLDICIKYLALKVVDKQDLFDKEIVFLD